MLITSWHPGEEKPWEMQHSEILAFAHKYGRRMISAANYRALMKLIGRDFQMPGSSLLLATIHTEDGPRLAGFSCVTEYGQSINLVVVHPLYRGCGLGSKLLARQISLLGQLTCLVSPIRMSCLQMCFRSGLSASRLIKDRGGQVMLVLEKKREDGKNDTSLIEANSAVNSLQGR